ncbi:MAG: hypothetical protein AB7G11_11240 [Phycisphaerales bacterium]
MIASSQPARMTLSPPAPAPAPADLSAAPGPVAPPSPASKSSASQSDPAPSPGEDPTQHPLVKGVVEKFAAKIIDVRRKDQ